MRISDCSSDVCSSDPGGDTDPGTYYLFDKGTSQLRPLILSRPELGGYKLASVQPVNVKASDGTLIPAYLTLPPQSSGKNLPAIVMPHGGPGPRDAWGFDWTAQYFDIGRASRRGRVCQYVYI